MTCLKRPLRLVASALLLGLLAPAGADAVTRTYDSGAGGGASQEWHNPLNWSEDTVPTAADDAVIPGGQQTTVTTAQSVNSLTVGTALQPANLTVSGASGVLTVVGGAPSTLNGAVNAQGGGTLTLQGATTWNSGGMSGDNNGLIDNEGAMTINTGAGGSNFTGWSNAGTVTYSGTDVMGIGSATLVNTGTIQTTAGELNINATIGGGSSGDWAAGSNSTLSFSTTGSLTGDADLTGDGTMHFQSGTITIPASGSYAVAGTSHFGSGFLSLGVAGTTGRFVGDGGGGRSGSATLTVDGIVGQPSQTTASSTNFSGGQTIVKDTSNAPDLTIGGAVNVNNGGTLTLEGQTTWSGSNISSATGSGGTIDNDGTMTITTGAANSTFADWANSGTITYQGTDTLGFSSGVFVNTGTVQTTAGVLEAGPIGSGSSGDWTAGAASVLAFTNTSTLAIGADVSGDGTVQFSSGTTTLPTGTSYAVAGITKLAGGTLSLTPAGTTGRLIADGGGGRTGVGTLTVNGVAGQPSQIVSSITNFGGGNTIIGDGPNAVDLTIASSVAVNPGGTLTSMGTSQWTDGSFGGEATGTIDNRGPMTITTGADGSNFSRWVNSGSIAYTGTDAMTMSPTLKNTGTMTTSGAAGSLDVGAVETGSNGDWTAGAGSTISFNGTTNLASGADVGGAGTVQVGSTTVTAPTGTTMSPGTLVLDNNDNLVHGGTGAPGSLQIAPDGVLSGAGTMIPSAFTWSGGTMSGTGRTEIPAGATLTLSGAKALDRRLRLERDLDVVAGIGTFSGDGILEAAIGATIDFVDDAGDIGGTVLVRAGDQGTIRKSGGAGGASETEVGELSTINGGTISVEQGRLDPFNGTTNNGTVTVASGATLDSSVTNDSGGVEGAGTITGNVTNAVDAFVRGTLTIGGALTNAGIVSPGTSAGTITAASYSGAGELVMELVSAVSFDRLVLTGAASLANSTLTIERPGGFVPATSATFDVVTAGTTVTGTPTLQGHVITPEHRLQATALNGQSPAPAGRLRLSSVTEDLTAPDTTITDGPAGGSTTNDSTPTFAFTATEDGSTFACSVDGGAAAPCTSPHTTSALADGPHTFSVGATDAAGNTDASPATRSFTVDTKPPPVVVTPAPEPRVEPKPAPKVVPPAPAQLTPTALTAVANEVLKALPSTRRCVSRRRLAIRLRPARGATIGSVEIRVGTKKPLVLRGRRITAPVVLAGLPKGRFTVKVTMKLANGQQVVTTRRYRTCVPKGRRS